MKKLLSLCMLIYLTPIPCYAPLDDLSHTKEVLFGVSFERTEPKNATSCFVRLRDFSELQNKQKIGQFFLSFENDDSLNSWTVKCLSEEPFFCNIDEIFDCLKNLCVFSIEKSSGKFLHTLSICYPRKLPKIKTPYTLDLLCGGTLSLKSIFSEYNCPQSVRLCLFDSPLIPVVAKNRVWSVTKGAKGKQGFKLITRVTGTQDCQSTFISETPPEATLPALLDEDFIMTRFKIDKNSVFYIPFESIPEHYKFSDKAGLLEYKLQKQSLSAPDGVFPLFVGMDPNTKALKWINFSKNKIEEAEINELVNSKPVAFYETFSEEKKPIMCVHITWLFRTTPFFKMGPFYILGNIDSDCLALLRTSMLSQCAPHARLIYQKALSLTCLNHNKTNFFQGDVRP
jgi:hypothetical protein